MAFKMILALLLIWPLTVRADAALDADLLYKTLFGTPDDVRILLERGASPNALNEEGMPPLMLLAERQEDVSIRIGEVLIAGGADLNLGNAKGVKPIHHAIRQKNVPILHLLLSKGADFYAKDPDGLMPEQLALKGGDARVIALVSKAVEIDRDRYNAARSANREEEMLRTFSYQNCVMNYLYYYDRDQKKLDPENLDAETKATYAKREKALVNYMNEIVTTFGVPPRPLEKIGQVSRSSIASELDELVSPYNRRQKGFGKAEDMKARCDKIASKWGTADLRGGDKFENRLREMGIH